MSWFKKKKKDWQNGLAHSQTKWKREESKVNKIWDKRWVVASDSESVASDWPGNTLKIYIRKIIR